MPNIDEILKDVERINRREALARIVSLSAILTLGSSKALLISGCGGTTRLPDSTPTPPTLWPVPLPQDLVAQVDLFSAIVDEFSSFTVGESEANQRFDSLLSSASSRSDERPVETHVKFMYTAFAFRVLYERLCRAMYSLAKLGYIGDTVSTQNNLTGSASLSNPQWLAAVMGQVYSLMTICSSMLQLQQRLKIEEVKNWILSISDPAQRSIAYALAAICFNQWVEYHARQSRVSTNGLLLDVSSNMHPARIESELARIPTILNNLPYSPSYCAPRSRNSIADYYTDNQLFDPVDFTASLFQGSLERFLTWRDKSITNIYLHYEELIRIGSFEIRYSREFFTTIIQRAPFLVSLQRELGEQVFKTGVRIVAEQLLRPYGNIGSVVGSLADVFLNARLAGMAISLATSGGILPVTLAALTGYSLVSAIQNLIRVSPEFHAYLESLLGFAQYLDRNRPTSRGKDVRPKTVGRYILCLILRSMGLGRYTIALPRPQNNVRPALSLGDSDLAAASELLLGIPNSRYPRTFQQVQTAAVNTMYDYLNRHSRNTAPTINNNSLTYVASNFAMLRRRAAEESAIEVPLISDAELMQVAPGFIPRRAEGVDLNTVEELPPIEQLSPFGLGGKINVR